MPGLESLTLSFQGTTKWYFRYLWQMPLPRPEALLANKSFLFILQQFEGIDRPSEYSRSPSRRQQYHRGRRTRCWVIPEPPDPFLVWLSGNGLLRSKCQTLKSSSFRQGLILYLLAGPTLASYRNNGIFFFIDELRFCKDKLFLV